jgi:hypothetical protein
MQIKGRAARALQDRVGSRESESRRGSRVDDRRAPTCGLSRCRGDLWRYV